MAGERRLGKRLRERLEWLRETPGADSFGPEAWEREAARCREEGLCEPDREEWLRDSAEAGWAPLDPCHVELLAYERLRARIGDLAMEGPAGPPLEWPAAWGRWSLAEHRATIAEHWEEFAEIRAQERG